MQREKKDSSKLFQGLDDLRVARLVDDNGMVAGYKNNSFGVGMPCSIQQKSPRSEDWTGGSFENQECNAHQPPHEATIE
jgi:hypothetical protein